jgi:hypothetical protein
MVKQAQMVWLLSLAALSLWDDDVLMCVKVKRVGRVDRNGCSSAERKLLHGD